MLQTPAAGRTKLVLVACDANVPVLVFVGYGLLRLGDPMALLLSHPWLLLAIFAFPAALALAGSYIQSSWWRSPQTALQSAGATLLVALLFGVGYAVAGGRSSAREVFAALATAMIVEVFAVRSLIFIRVRRAQAIRPALVVGAGADGCAVVDCTLREPQLRVRVAGFIDDDPLKRNFQYKGVNVVGDAPRLSESAAQHRVDLVICAVSRPLNAVLIKNLLQLKMSGVEIVEMPTFVEKATGQCPIRHVEDAWFIYHNGFNILHRKGLRYLKRGVDLAISSLGLLAALPLMAIVALLIKLDSRGPVFSRQERVGKGERPFLLLKFRTMRAGLAPAAVPGLAGGGDFRVTRVGRWLRLTRLDEIPQFINVFWGEMSFIGPRAEQPLRVEQLKAAVPYFGLRFSVKPGLIGWAQVQSGYGGASGEETIEKLKYDLYYIKHMSFPLDAVIVLKTLKIVLFSRGG